jgi:hypothetical protein
MGVFKVEVEVTHDERGASSGARCSCRPERIRPRSVVGGDVYSHHVETFVPCDKLEGQEVGGDHVGRLHLERVMPFFPQQGNPPLAVARRLRRDDLVPRRVFWIFVGGWGG